MKRNIFIAGGVLLPATFVATGPVQATSLMSYFITASEDDHSIKHMGGG